LKRIAWLKHRFSPSGGQPSDIAHRLHGTIVPSARSVSKHVKMIKTKECLFMKIAIPFIALGLLVGPTLMGTNAVGENSSVRAEDIRIGIPGVGVRVEDRDRDYDRDRHWRRNHNDREVIVIKKPRRDRDRDDD
jgi:hypothetical protein